MNEMKFVGLTLAIIIFCTLFTPFSYACPTCSVNLGSIRNKSNPAACGSVVQTVEMNWTEFQKLVETVNNSVYDAFGNNERGATEKEYEDAGLSNDPAVNQAKNQFVMTDQGPMMLFDLMQHGVANPNNACHLTHVITTGYIGYSTNVDQSVRFCSEYPSSSCESGRLTGEDTEDAANSLEAMGELQTLIEAEEIDWPAVKKQLNSMKGEWIQVITDSGRSERVFAGSEFADEESIERTLKTIIEQIDEEQYDEARVSIYQLIEAQTDVLSKILGYSPWNFVESNYTEMGMTNADQVYMFPHNLAAFIKNLADLAGKEQWIATVNIAASVVGVANIAGGIAAAKLMTKGDDIAKITAKNFDKAQDTMKTSLKNSADYWDNLARSAEKSRKAADAAGDSAKAARKAAEAAEFAKKAESAKDVLKQVEAAKSAEALQTLIDTGKVSKMDGTTAVRQLRNTVTNTDNIDGYPLGPTEKNWYGQLIDSGNLDPKDANKVWSNVQNQVTQQGKRPELWEPFLNRFDYMSEAAGIGKIGGYNEMITISTKGVTTGDSAKSVMRGALFEKAYGKHSARLLSKLEGVDNSYSVAKSAQLGSKIAARVAIWAVEWFTLTNKIIDTWRLFYAIAFYMHAFGGTPVSFYEISAPIFTLRPASTIIGSTESSYVELIMLSPAAGLRDYDIYPDSFFENIVQYFNIDFREMVSGEHYTALQKKIKKMGDYVTIVDQESRADMLTEQGRPTNLIYPVQDNYGVVRWYFHSLNPDTTMAYFFENPRAYYKKGNEAKYTAMGLLTNNVNISGMTTVEYDWVKYKGDWLYKVLPSWKTVALSSFTAGIYAPLAGGSMSGVKILIAVGVTQALGGQLTEYGKTVHAKQMGYGNWVDIEEAFSSGNRCSEVKKEKLKDIHYWLGWKEFVAYVNLGLEVTELALTASGVGAPIAAVVFLVGGIATALADMYTSDEYMKAKEEGLAAMKECYETQYEILAWQAILTEAETSDTFTEEFLSQGADVIKDVLGPTINSISPEVRDAIRTVGQDYYYSTLNMIADPIQGLSLINMYGTDVYQIHFDREASIEWFAEQTCQIELCDQMADGSYKCIAKQGYFLFDSEGNVIFDGPQMQFLRWSNLETYASIPQRIINIRQADDELMKVYSNKISVTNDCVLEEIISLAKTEAGDRNAGGVFGDFEIINTGRQVVWIEGESVVVHFLKETNLGKRIYRASETMRWDNANIVILRDGSVKVEDSSGKDLLGGALELKDDGAIKFENAMMIKGKSDSVTRRGTTYTSSYGYTRIDGGNVLHLAIRDLLTLSPRELNGLTLSELCEEDGKVQGVTMQALLGTETEEQANELLADICMAYFEGSDGTRMEIRDDQICTVYPDGTEVCQKIEGLSNGNLMLEDGSWWKAEVFDGVPQWAYYNAMGQKQSSIPMLWMSGLGGTMAYNPGSGEITIKNEFPFSINPAFNQYGALASPGMATPARPEWYGREPASTGSASIGATQPNLLAQLPLLPEDSGYLMLFIIILMSSLIAVRVKHSKLKIEKIEE